MPWVLIGGHANAAPTALKCCVAQRLIQPIKLDRLQVGPSPSAQPNITCTARDDWSGDPRDPPQRWFSPILMLRGSSPSSCSATMQSLEMLLNFASMQ
jgi:hypothetical protein